MTLRTCVACRRRAAPEELVRLAFVDDRILVSRTAPGRGAWLCPDPACLERANRTGAVARALRRPAAVRLPWPDDWPEVVIGAGNGDGRGVRG